MESKNLKLKNTFLHMEGGASIDDFGFVQEMRRQASEPAPMLRQLSSAARDNFRRLGSCHENDAETFDETEIFHPPELDEDFDVLGSAPKRQISSFSAGGEMDRQTSSFSAGNICRQVTEQEWPSYILPHPTTGQLEITQGGSQEAASSTDPYPSGIPSAMNASHEAAERADAVRYMPTPMMDPAALAAACAVNTTPWPGMLLNGQDFYTGVAASADKPPRHRNRRKARSLVTQAQEAQKQKQQEWAQAQMMLQAHQQMMFQGQMQAMLGLPADTKSTSQRAGLKVQADVPREAAKRPTVPEPSPEPSADMEEVQLSRKFCPNCGGKIKQHFKFCQFCGGDLLG